MLVSVVQQSASAIGVHMHPPFLSPPPDRQVTVEHHAELPVPSSIFPQVVLRVAVCARECCSPNSLHSPPSRVHKSTFYIYIAIPAMKIGSMSLITREIQIRTAMRHHLTPVRTSTNFKYWRGCEEKGTLLYPWWECELTQPLWRTVWSFLKKLETELAYDPALPLLGTHPEKNVFQKDTCAPVLTAVLFATARQGGDLEVCQQMDG